MLPGLPFLPFALLGGVMAFMGYALPRRQAANGQKEQARVRTSERAAGRVQGLDQGDPEDGGDRALRSASQLAIQLLNAHGELAHRVSKMRRKFAKQYGFVIPEIKLTDDLSIGAKDIPYQDITARSWRSTNFASARCSCCLTAIASRTCRATRRLSRPSA